MARVRKESRAVNLKPLNVLNVRTGELNNFSQLNHDIKALIDYCQKWSSTHLENNLQDIMKKQSELVDKKGNPRKLKPAEAARQVGYVIDYGELPKETLAKSRINKLAGSSLLTAVDSYVKRVNKQEKSRRNIENTYEPRMGKKISLGSVDPQMASMSVDAESMVLTLHWKCWLNEYLVEFRLPSYTRELRNVSKWCLPDVFFKRDGFNDENEKLYEGSASFAFAYEVEVPDAPSSDLTGGIDLGRLEPYVMAITNERGGRVAHYGANGRVKQGWSKCERRKREVSHLHEKIQHLDALGLKEKADELRVEKERTLSKNTRAKVSVSHQQAADITYKLKKHQLNTVNVEYLGWVQGAKYGSRWNHSEQQNHIKEALSLKGVRMVKVNPRNSSNDCHKCLTPVTHRPKNRTVWCSECKKEFNRDYNAAMNIANDHNQAKKKRLKKLAKNNNPLSLRGPTGHGEARQPTTDGEQPRSKRNTGPPPLTR